MKKGLVSKILSGGLAAAMVFSVFSPSVLVDRDRSLYQALKGEDCSIPQLERVLEKYDYNYYIDCFYDHDEVYHSSLLSALWSKCPPDILK